MPWNKKQRAKFEAENEQRRSAALAAARAHLPLVFTAVGGVVVRSTTDQKSKHQVVTLGRCFREHGESRFILSVTYGVKTDTLWLGNDVSPVKWVDSLAKHGREAAAAAFAEIVLMYKMANGVPMPSKDLLRTIFLRLPAEF